VITAKIAEPAKITGELLIVTCVPTTVVPFKTWGLTASQLNAGMDPELLAAIAAFLLLVIFTGYLIIYNILFNI